MPFFRDAHDLIIFYLYTGARTSEALYPNLRWECIGSNNIEFPRTKMYRARVIPLTREVARILASRRHIEGGPFFTSVDSSASGKRKVLTRDMVYNRTEKIFSLAGINDVSTHNLRKTAGAYYYIATRDIFATSRYLGHSSVKVTEKHYAGLIQSMQIDDSKKFA